MSVSTLPEIQPLSGAAAIPGPEADLASRFMEHAASRSRNAILAPEVPIRDGVVDLLKLQFLRPADIRELEESKSLAKLQDRALFTLASFRPNQRYTLGHLARTNVDWIAVDELASFDLIVAQGDAFVRPSHLVDRIQSVTSYEFKAANSRGGLRQAALRRSVVTRSYLVTTVSPNGAVPDPQEFRRLGVGWIRVDTRPIRRIGARRFNSPRWARLVILRSIERGLERHSVSHRSVRS